jgi:DNA-binding CsgD family transcriptional regulator
VREREVVALAVTGHENKDIAYRLGLAYSTIRVLMARAASKIGAKSRQELIEKLSAIPVQEGTPT